MFLDVRQADVISPKLLISTLAYAFKTIDWTDKEIGVDVEKLHHLSYSEDIVLIMDDWENIVCSQIGLKIIFIKTKYMTNLISSEQIIIHNTEIELVDRWATYGALGKIFKSNILISMKRRVFNQCMLPIIT